MERHSIVAIIPAFNEGNSISAILQQAKRFADVIVINDGSEDQTSFLAKEAGAIVIDHEKNMGYDIALDNGFKKACELGFKYAITLDADGQHDPALIQTFFKRLENGSYLVTGVREKKQRLTEKLFSIFTYIRWGIKDPLCGIKGYNLSIYTKLGYFDKDNLIGTELLLYAVSKNYKIEQINIKTKERVGNSKFGSSLSANLKILKAMILALIKYF